MVVESNSQKILIVGGGAAGLAAAVELKQRGQPCQVLEARNRLGGRVQSVSVPGSVYPVELGAEFIHGRPELFHSYLENAEQVPDESWQADAGELKPWEANDELETVLEAISCLVQNEDLPMEQALDKIKNQFQPSAIRRVKLWTTGFHVARLADVSARAIAGAGASSGSAEDEASYRLAGGYASVVDGLSNILGAENKWCQRSRVVERIDWKPKSVLVRVRTPNGMETLSAEKVLLTIPVSVWSQIAFTPDLPPAKRAAQACVASGPVHRVTLLFRQPFWLRPGFNPSFIQSFDSKFPVLWTHRPFDGLRFVCWCGGDIAEKVKDPINEALESLAQALGCATSVVKQHLLSSHYHDWNADPFSKGAYAYFRPGYEKLLPDLATPVEDTLFFAGEAMAPAGRNGTVDGAMESGIRAARQILGA
jgi:monoamine oxidase